MRSEYWVVYIFIFFACFVISIHRCIRLVEYIPHGFDLQNMVSIYEALKFLSHKQRVNTYISWPNSMHTSWNSLTWDTLLLMGNSSWWPQMSCKVAMGRTNLWVDSNDSLDMDKTKTCYSKHESTTQIKQAKNNKVRETTSTLTLADTGHSHKSHQNGKDPLVVHCWDVIFELVAVLSHPGKNPCLEVASRGSPSNRVECLPRRERVWGSLTAWIEDRMGLLLSRLALPSSIHTSNIHLHCLFESELSFIRLIASFLIVSTLTDDVPIFRFPEGWNEKCLMENCPNEYLISFSFFYWR